MRTTRLAYLALMVAGGFLTLTPAQAHAQKKSRDLITREEIEGSAQRDQDIFQVIRSLRPHFLAAPRGVRTLGGSSLRTALFVDGVKESDVNALKSIDAQSVEEVRYLDPTRSESEYGPGASGGAVVVKRRIKTLVPPAPFVRDTTKPPQR